MSEFDDNPFADPFSVSVHRSYDYFSNLIVKSVFILKFNLTKVLALSRTLSLISLRICLIFFRFWLIIFPVLEHLFVPTLFNLKFIRCIPPGQGGDQMCSETAGLCSEWKISLNRGALPTSTQSHLLWFKLFGLNFFCLERLMELCYSFIFTNSFQK